MKYTALFSLLVFLHTSVFANDLNRQFNSEALNEILIGNDSAYSMRIESQRALSLGLATIFISPNGGQLSFHSTLALAEELSLKGWHVDLVSPSWLSIPILEKSMMMKDAMLDDKQAMMQDTMLDDKQAMKQDAMLDDKQAMMKDAVMDDKQAMMKDAVMDEKQAMMKAEKMLDKATHIEPWMSSMDMQMDFDGLSRHMSNLLTGLSSHSEDINGFRLVIAEGVVAALILSAAQEYENNNASSFADGLTLISPFWPQSQTNQRLANLSAEISIPILDLNIAASNRFARTTASNRAKKARTQVKLNYRQRLISSVHRYNNSNLLGGEIVGWTRSLGW